jgi:CHASE3 domain sensor protein
MNTALEQIQEARVEAALGQTAEAQALQDQARGTLEKIITESPGAQQQAQLEATRRSTVVLAFIPITVVVCTVASYVAVRVWRRYDRSRLYEMRIVNEKKD